MQAIADVAECADAGFALILAVINHEQSRLEVKVGSTFKRNIALLDVAVAFVWVERDVHIIIVCTINT